MDKIKIKLTDFDAVIFDMDGTMINNAQHHKQAWKEFAKRYGLSLTDEEFKKKVSGKKNDKILVFVFGRELSAEEIEKYSEEKEAVYRELYAPDIKAVEGLHDTINTLKKANKKLAVATTAPESNRNFGFNALQLTSAFPVVLGDEHVTEGKPHPEIYLETAKELHVDPSRCLVFEDSPPGAQAGKNAGMTVVGVLTSHTKEELTMADYLIKDFTGILFI